MKVIWQSKDYAPEAILKRYVRYGPWDGGVFEFCEVGIDRRFDLRQGTVTADELPRDLAEAAIAHYEVSMSYLEWPHDAGAQRSHGKR
jgi:hypothetical protein